MVKIIPQDKKVIVRNEKGEQEENYDILLIATGSYPQVTGINYQESDRIFMLKNLYDMEKIDVFIKKNPAAKCAVVGGGYIGVEMLEAFKSQGTGNTSYP